MTLFMNSLGLVVVGRRRRRRHRRVGDECERVVISDKIYPKLPVSGHV